MRKLELEEISTRCTPELLSTGSVFGAISVEATRFLLENGTIYQVAAGESVFGCGDRGTSFFVVCEGELAYFKRHKGHETMTRRVAFGEEVGFVAMIGLHDHLGHADALEDSVVLEIDAALFGDLHQHFPLDFGLMLMNLARELARTVRKLSDTIVENDILGQAVRKFG